MIEIEKAENGYIVKRLAEDEDEGFAYHELYVYSSLDQMMVQLFDKIREWATSKGIFRTGTLPAQIDKFYEEVDELSTAIANGDSLEDIKLELGDVVVTLVIVADMYGFSIEEAIAAAYKKISTRQGHMKDGVFIKN